MDNCIKIIFVGLCRPCVHGVGVWAYIIFNNDVVIHQASAVAGAGMNAYEANLMGLLAACQWLNQRQLPGSVFLLGNNETALKQVRGLWKLKVSKAKQVVPTIRQLLAGREVLAGLLSPEQIAPVRKLAETQYRARND